MSAASLSCTRRAQVLVQLLQGDEAWVVDVAVDELRQPRVADAAFFGDALPITSTLDKRRSHQRVQPRVGRFSVHERRLAKRCLTVKQHIATAASQHGQMPAERDERTINQVLADNLAHFMSA